MRSGKKRLCVVCGDIFTRQGKRKTCGTSCSDVYARIRAARYAEEKRARDEKIADRKRKAEMRYEKGWKRQQGSDGYIALHGRKAAQHPMAKHGWVNEHVYICYNTYQKNPTCAYCGLRLRWSHDLTSDLPLVNVDHVDDDKTNNSPENLVPSCITCNTRKNKEYIRLFKQGVERRQHSGPGTCGICGKEFANSFSFAGHCAHGCSGSEFIPLKTK